MAGRRGAYGHSHPPVGRAICLPACPLAQCFPKSEEEEERERMEAARPHHSCCLSMCPTPRGRRSHGARKWLFLGLAQALGGGGKRRVAWTASITLDSPCYPSQSPSHLNRPIPLTAESLQICSPGLPGQGDPHLLPLPSISRPQHTGQEKAGRLLQ